MLLVLLGCTSTEPTAAELAAARTRCADSGGGWRTPEDRPPHCVCPAGDEPIPPGDGVFHTEKGCMTYREGCEAAGWRWQEAVLLEETIQSADGRAACGRLATSSHRTVVRTSWDGIGSCAKATYEPARCYSGESIQTVRMVRHKLTGITDF